MAEAALNERQRAYVRAIFDTDQAVEADMRAIPFQTRPKASDWHLLEYSEPIAEIGKPASRLYAAIKRPPGSIRAQDPHSRHSPTEGSSRSTSADPITIYISSRWHGLELADWVTLPPQLVCECVSLMPMPAACARPLPSCAGDPIELQPAVEERSLAARPSAPWPQRAASRCERTPAGRRASDRPSQVLPEID